MPQLYYADATQTPVGPLSLEQLKELHATGAVTGSTPVIEEGATAWNTYDGVVRRDSPFPPYQPPPTSSNGKSEEERVREQMAAQAAQMGAHAARAARVAGATANVFTGSVLETVKRATSPGEKAVVFGSLTGLVAFFLPWISVFGQGASGFGLAREASAWLWLFPLSVCACFFLSYLNITSTWRQRLLRARWLMLIGAFWATITLLPVVVGNRLGGGVTFGLWLALLAMLAVTIGATLQVTENLPAGEIR